MVKHAIDSRVLFLGVVALCAVALVYLIGTGKSEHAAPRPAVVAPAGAGTAPSPFSGLPARDAAVPTSVPAPVDAPAPAEPVSIDGKWAGKVTFGSSVASFAFDLRAVSGTLSGTATFPIGTGTVEEGKFDGRRIAFTTRHRKPDGQVLLSRFEGEVAGREMQLDMRTQGSTNPLTLYRASP
jgi:hypothetical protein